MTRSGFLHFKSKVPRMVLVFLPVSPLMIGLLYQSAFSADASKGEQLYQQKICGSCHTIGGGRLVGPDLKGVTAKRERSWLIRWIMEPDKMLAEEDPQAKQIAQEYNNLPMPPSGATKAEVEDILAYIKAKSADSTPPAKQTTSPGSEKPSVAPTISPEEPHTYSEKGPALYKKICSACHTIGGGKQIGPDLKGVTSRRETNWLVRWIQEPDKVLAEGDSHATQLMQKHGNFPMPNYAISEAQAKDILAYIAAESGDSAMTKKTATQAKNPWETRPKPMSNGEFPNQVIGKKLFLGQKSLENGAPACITCHSNTEIGGMGGGTLGPDLTKVHSRYGGDIGLTSVLQGTPFATMKGVFLKQPLSEPEAVHLNAYFASTASMEEQPVNLWFIVIGIGIGFLGFVVCYILIHLIWKERLTGVRIPLVGR
jgi:mono/diheme cytochrome c family protein